MVGRHLIWLGATLGCGALVAVAGAPVAAQTVPTPAQARAIQDHLKVLGFDPGGVDGKWGQQSVQALRRFQRTEGLAETGRADPGTTDRLRQRRITANGPDGQRTPAAVTPNATLAPPSAAVVASEPPGLLALPLPPAPPPPLISALPAPAVVPAASVEPGSGPVAGAAALDRPMSTRPTVPPATGLVVPPSLLALWFWGRRAKRRASSVTAEKT